MKRKNWGPVQVATAMAGQGSRAAIGGCREQPELFVRWHCTACCHGHHARSPVPAPGPGPGRTCTPSPRSHQTHSRTLIPPPSPWICPETTLATPPLLIIAPLNHHKLNLLLFFSSSARGALASTLVTNYGW